MSGSALPEQSPYAVANAQILRGADDGLDRKSIKVSHLRCARVHDLHTAVLLFFRFRSYAIVRGSDQVTPTTASRALSQCLALKRTNGMQRGRV
jgi:hypothetical protein